MLIIDSDTFFGTQSGSAADTSLEALINTEKSQGVSYCLSSCIKARAYDAKEGNDHTLEAAKKNAEILPVATVDPRAFRNVEAEIERTAKLGFVALRVFPELQGWTVDSLLFQKIVNTCERYALPLMLSAESPGKASRIIQQAANTTIPIILLNVNYNLQAEAFEAVNTRKYTYLSTQFFTTPGIYEIAVEATGADKLVLGTACPAFSVRQATSMVFRSSLSEKDKALILGQNIKNIISSQLKRLGKELAASAPDNFFDKQKISRPIIDIHGHLGPWPFPMADCNAPDIRHLMQRRGIEKCVLSGTKAIVNDFVEGNLELAEAINGSDDIFGYITINPNFPKKSIEEIKRYSDLPNFAGIKLHPSYAACPMDSDIVKQIVNSAPQPVPFLVHTWGPGEVARAANLAKSLPDFPVIMGHGGAQAWREAINAMEAVPNLYTEFCCSASHRGKVRETLNAVGAERVLFGTDLGLFDPAYNLGTYEEANLTPDEEFAIVQGNARKLFGFS